MTQDPIAHLRRFNRIVTTQLGVLDASFLGRGRPLGAARVLNAIGQGRQDVADIRSYLGLDSGLMSRLLRELEQEGLIETTPHPEDGRRRLVELTCSGRREFDAYEALSRAQAEALIKRCPDQKALIAALDLVASSFGRAQIAITEADPQCEQARYCLGEYYAELSQRLDGGFDATLSRDPEAKDMRPPRGVFLLALSEGLPIGCAGLKGSGGAVAEIKRLWVAPSARGLGVGGDLMARIEHAAQELGINTLRLDTNSTLPEAEKFYRNRAWTQIDRFNDDPYPDLFFEKRLA